MKNDFFYFHIDVKYQTNHLCQTDCLTTIKICNNAKDLYKYGNNAMVFRTLLTSVFAIFNRRIWLCV